MVRGQILKARKFSKSKVSSKQKHVGNKTSFVFNITYYQVFLKLKNVLSEIHLLLTPYKEHGKALEKIPIIGFRKVKNLKDILMRQK